MCLLPGEEGAHRTRGEGGCGRGMGRARGPGGSKRRVIEGGGHSERGVVRTEGA